MFSNEKLVSFENEVSVEKSFLWKNEYAKKSNESNLRCFFLEKDSKLTFMSQFQISIATETFISKI